MLLEGCLFLSLHTFSPHEKINHLSPAIEKAELVAADAVKLSDGRLLFAFIQKGGSLAAKLWIARGFSG